MTCDRTRRDDVARHDFDIQAQAGWVHLAADKQNDALDHDMLHACAVMSGWAVNQIDVNNYVRRFLNEAWDRFVQPVIESV